MDIMFLNHSLFYFTFKNYAVVKHTIINSGKSLMLLFIILVYNPAFEYIYNHFQMSQITEARKY
jgi:hypothetical protein